MENPVEITVSITLSKSFIVDKTCEDIEQAVRLNTFLPDDILVGTTFTHPSERVRQAAMGWNVDELTIIED